MAKTKKKKPQVIWSTPMQRTLLDFKITTSDPAWRPRITREEYLRGVTSETQRLLKSVQRLYLISFIAASVVLAGGFPTNAEVNLFGMQVPAGVLSLQALSAIMVGIYSYFIAMLVSATMAYGILMCIFSQTYTESWDVFLAEYDATMLNANFLRPKHIGFASPKRERLAAWGVALTSFATLLLHWAVIVFAAYVALAAAMDAGSLVPTIIGGFALGAAVVGGLAYVTCTMVPMPYRMYDDDAQDAMTGEAELKPAAAAT